MVFPFSLFAQDTVNIRPFERRWTQPRMVPRAGIGVQGVAFAEIGLQRHQIYVHPLSLASAGPYISVEAIIDDTDLILGPRLGMEVAAGLLGFGLDFTDYTDFDHHVLALTPKAGISVFGFVNLYYGYNFILTDNHFPVISHHRLAISCTLNRDYFNVRSAPRRR